MVPELKTADIKKLIVEDVRNKGANHPMIIAEAALAAEYEWDDPSDPAAYIQYHEDMLAKKNPNSSFRCSILHGDNLQRYSRTKTADDQIMRFFLGGHNRWLIETVEMPGSGLTRMVWHSEIAFNELIKSEVIKLGQAGLEKLVVAPRQKGFTQFGPPLPRDIKAWIEAIGMDDLKWRFSEKSCALKKTNDALILLTAPTTSKGYYVDLDAQFISSANGVSFDKFLPNDTHSLMADYLAAGGTPPS